VVIRGGDPDPERLARTLGAVPVVNADPDRGMFSSVQEGLRVVFKESDPPDALVLFPVDHPRVRPETVRTLLAAFSERPETTWVQPACAERPGHPIVIDAATARRLPGLSPTIALRDALRSLALTGHRIPVEDTGVLANLNRPADG
jgi:CTP:molybdopterin cytidylyltransferase MocA